jgi:hypothetical protein
MVSEWGETVRIFYRFMDLENSSEIAHRASQKSFYLILKNLVLPREAGSPMGHACPALRESEFSGSAWRNAARV